MKGIKLVLLSFIAAAGDVVEGVGDAAADVAEGVSDAVGGNDANNNGK